MASARGHHRRHVIRIGWLVSSYVVKIVTSYVVKISVSVVTLAAGRRSRAWQHGLMGSRASAPAAIDFIVCAHNEAATVGPVVCAILAAELGPVLVVADRCRDDTPDVAYRAGAAVLVAAAGDKGTAMHLGLAHGSAPRVGFIDGDLQGLAPEHVHRLASIPEAMVVGLRDCTQRMSGFPPIGGERVLPREIALRAGLLGAGYRAEMRLAAAAKCFRVPIVEVELSGVQHPTRLEPSRVTSRWRGVWGGYREYQQAARWRTITARHPPYAATD
jgi:hypothetical protein